MNKREIEQTLVLIKPDALKNSLTGYLLSHVSEFHTGLHFSSSKIVHVSRMLAEEHYAEHRGKIFYASLLDYIMGRLHYADKPWMQRVIAIVYQGVNATKKMRDLVGPTNPHIARKEKPGCIRALGTVVPLKDVKGNVIGERMDNLIHASVTRIEAEREIKLWFKPDDIPPLMHAYPAMVSEDYYYYKNKKLYTTPEQDSICFLVPGYVVWKSDLETLRQLSQGKPISNSLESIVAKYLINNRVNY